MEKEAIKKMIESGYYNEANREISKLLKRNERISYGEFAIKKSMELINCEECKPGYCKIDWNCKAAEWLKRSPRSKKFISSVIRFATYSIYSCTTKEEYNRIYAEIVTHGFRLLS